MTVQLQGVQYVCAGSAPTPPDGARKRTGLLSAAGVLSPHFPPPAPLPPLLHTM